MRAAMTEPTLPVMGAVSCRTWKTCARLAPFVEELQLRVDRLGAVEIYMPLPARGDCFLQFYLADAYRVVTVATGGLHVAPRCVLVGPQTRRREDLIWSGHLRVFTIRFSPVGFRAIFGISASAIRDYAGHADLVLGEAVRELESRIAAAREDDLGDVAERFLLRRLEQSGPLVEGGPGPRLVRAMQKGLSVTNVAERYGLSARQVERIFQEQVGLPPKMVARLARLKRAIVLGNGTGRGEWTDVALRAGYFDQSHMVREFRDLNGATPVEYARLSSRAAAYRKLRGEARDVGFVLSGVPPRNIGSELR